MYVLNMAGTIILFIKEMHGNKHKKFSWSGVFSMVGAGMLTNYFFLFGLIMGTDLLNTLH